MARLEKAGYIEVEKEFVGRKPHTMLNLTDRGRAALDEYRENMKRMLGSLPSAGPTEG
jgi:DNA-binding PadR family transcriptional regulator